MDQTPTPPQAKPAKKAADASPAAAPEPMRLSFRVFAASLDLPTANALRVKLGIKHADLDKTFAESDLAAALDELNGTKENG